jgi:hypothetical protein
VFEPRKISLAFLMLLFFAEYSKPQTGGDNVYEFLNLTHSSVVAATGGSNVSLSSGDLNMVYHNPSLLDTAMDGLLTLNYVNYFAGINYGMSMYSFSTRRLGPVAAGLSYLNYGSFTETDESGNITGTFRAAEYALLLGWSKQIDSSFSAGILLKPVISHLERYTSIGFALDIGGNWRSKNGLTSAGIVIKNIGVQFTSYAGEAREKLPFEIQAGITQKLAHAPFRFSLTLRHLEKFDLTHSYSKPGSQDQGNSADGFAENLMRHIIAGAELTPHRNFYFAAGYNYQRRSELNIDQASTGAGLSWGFGFRTNWFSLGFGRATFHLAGASNHISLSLKPAGIYRKFRSN